MTYFYSPQHFHQSKKYRQPSIHGGVTQATKSGFTLIEILVTITILTVLITLGWTLYSTSLSRGRDVQRKTDLDTIHDAFEDYYNDNGCYPQEDQGYFEDCQQTLHPYLTEIPCDPLTKTPYQYVPLDNACQGYRVYAKLERENDPDVTRLGCEGQLGCGFVDPTYNYGVSSGVAVEY